MRYLLNLVVLISASINGHSIFAQEEDFKIVHEKELKIIKESEIIDSLILTIKNADIKYATMRPANAKTVLLEREIVVTAPYAGVILGLMVPKISHYLINHLEDEERDWAIHVILTAINKEDIGIVMAYRKDINEWKQKAKQADIKYWQDYIQRIDR